MGFLREVKAHVGQRTILGSGDLFTADDCLRMMQETGVDGVTVARGAIGNPWIFQQARAIFSGEPLPPPPTVREQGLIISEHYRVSEQVYGDRCGGMMRKFGIKYSALHPQSVDVRNAFVRIKTRTDWEQVLAKWYQTDEPGHYPDPSIHGPQTQAAPVSEASP